ncbi:MAG: hypothetical protein AB7G88_16025 [Thermomicrobiales bacterium]
MEQLVFESLRRFDSTLHGVDYLPPNCILERLHPGTIAVIPEPFASDLLARAETEGDIERLDLASAGEASWLFENYDVLIERSNEERQPSTRCLELLIAGREWLRTKPGPTGIGGVFARQIAAELEGVTVSELDSGERSYLGPGAINANLVLTNYQDASVIDPADPLDPNWRHVRCIHERLGAAGILRTLTRERLAECIDCSAVRRQTTVNGHSATYPLRVNRYLTNDTPGKVRDMLDALQTDDVDLSFLLAQRISGAGGVGLVYMLPTLEEDRRKIQQAAGRHEWIAAGRTGFVAVRFPHRARSLRQMLDVVHVDADLSIDTLVTFPGPGGQAIALMSFGDISDVQLRRLLTGLEEHGFELPHPVEWTAG